MWITFIIQITCFGFILKFLFKWENSYFDQNISTHLLAFGILCQQGANARASLISSRTLIACMLLSSVLLYNFYTSMLVSMIVETRHETDIKTKEDLADSDIEIGFLDGIATRFFLKVYFFEELLKITDHSFSDVK